MAGAKKNVASTPTPANATLIGRRREGEEVQFPRRVFDCPGCGVKWVIEPDEAVKSGETLHFEFECADCDYAAAVGLT